MRIALAKLLLARPNLLLMDEPTNHLDLPARNWLEEYLGDYPGSVVLVSHDRYFLDATVKRITEVGLKTLTDYHGNYTHYAREHAARMERLREAHRRQSEEIEKAEVFINRFRYTATKAKQVQSRIKLLDKVERIEIPPERKKIHFHFPEAKRPGRVVLELKGARKAYGANVVIRHLDLMVERGDRIALVGPNGAGKSTLMRLLAGIDRPDEGVRLEGHNVVMDYFAQNQAEVLNPARTVVEEMSASSSLSMAPMIRTILGGFLFEGDDVFKKVAVLSGGERNRLALAKMLLQASNVLLLDEPDEPPRPRLEGDPPRGAGGLRRHARLRLPRPLLRRQAREQGHRGRRGRGAALPRRVRGLPVLEEAARGRRRRAHADRRQPPGQGGGRRHGVGRDEEDRHGSAAPRPSPPATAPAAAKGRGSAAAGGRDHPTAGKGAAKPAGKAGSPDGSNGQPPAPANPMAPRLRPSAATPERQVVERELKRAKVRLVELEKRVTEKEQAVKELEAQMSAPCFYDDRARAAQAAEDHQKLMWETGDLMGQWEALQAEVDEKSEQLAAITPPAARR